MLPDPSPSLAPWPVKDRTADSAGARRRTGHDRRQAYGGQMTGGRITGFWSRVNYLATKPRTLNARITSSTPKKMA
jgi:hypothetical protein